MPAIIAYYYHSGYRFGSGLYFDWTFLLLIAGAVLCMIASGVMRSTTAKFDRIASSSGVTGKEAARRILQAAGITDVRIGRIEGNLTDHYDPRTKVVNLADESYERSSLTGIGVAAHECGHAIQHATGYALLSFRSAIVPVVNFGANLSWPIFIAGLIFSFQPLPPKK